MTPLVRFVWRWRERLLGKYYEGPEPPDRLREMVLLFANANPFATRQEWLDFAAHHAGECYRTGYLRGFEQSERDPNTFRDHDPDALADDLEPGWRRRPNLLLDDPDDIASDDGPSERQVAALQSAAWERGRRSR